MAKARSVGVGMDYSPTSKAALKWAAENLVEAGDRIILIHVQPPKSDHTRKQLLEDTGSRIITYFLFHVLHLLLPVLPDFHMIFQL